MVPEGSDIKVNSRTETRGLNACVKRCPIVRNLRGIRVIYTIHLLN